jgi:formate-dependent nitrite reductase membrane component NrfD
MAGAAIFALVSIISGHENWMSILRTVIISALVINLFTLITELTITHPTTAAKTVVNMITMGRYRNSFWIGTVVIGNILPLLIILFTPGMIVLSIAAILILIGIYTTEKIWVEAPQRIPLA